MIDIFVFIQILIISSFLHKINIERNSFTTLREKHCVRFISNPVRPQFSELYQFLILNKSEQLKIYSRNIFCIMLYKKIQSQNCPDFNKNIFFNLAKCFFTGCCKCALHKTIKSHKMLFDQIKSVNHDFCWRFFLYCDFL